MDSTAAALLANIKDASQKSPMQKWTELTKLLSPTEHSFSVHASLFNEIYKDCANIKPAWVPTDEHIAHSNINKVMKKMNFSTYEEFYEWSIGEATRSDFWRFMISEVGIIWDTPPVAVFDLSDKSDGTTEERKEGIPHASYLPGGRLNIANSCFGSHGRESHEPALLYAMESDPKSLQVMSFGVLNKLSNQIANAIGEKLHLVPGDAIGICMPMTPESVAIYLGIVKAGCVVVSIADSFSSIEIETRCRLSNAKAIFTQDVIYRGAKFLPLYTRIQSMPEMKHLKVVVLPGMLHAGPYPKLSAMKRSPSGTWDDRDADGVAIQVHASVLPLIRENIDYGWHQFLHRCSDEFTAVICNSMDPCNILFSSGTTGEPKAIVWSHTTPIKCAIDGYLHQDIHEGENVVWPTNIGWMMGPFILFQLINGATVGIFNGITSTNAFCEYVEAAQMSLVGVIPSLVKAWQASGATDRCDWSCVRRFSSTGEASDPRNMLWLMSRVPGYAPIIEYCGGTEIGGSYMSSTMVQPNVPSMFSSPVLGSQIQLLDQEGKMQDSDGYISRSRSSSIDEGLSITSSPARGRARSYSGTNITMATPKTTTVVGELVIVPPALGLSTHLLNRDHYSVYYADMPRGRNGEVLRRHGDEVELIRERTFNTTSGKIGTIGSYYRALGRCDDTMNLGGIKISSVELERVCNTTAGVLETAAIAITPPEGGPSLLVVCVVRSPPTPPPAVEMNAATMSMSDLLKSQNTVTGKANVTTPPAPAAAVTLPEATDEEVAELKNKMQQSIKDKLNPLFHIFKVIITDKLPRTASNKIMRRVLRDEYVAREEAKMGKRK